MSARLFYILNYTMSHNFWEQNININKGNYPHYDQLVIKKIKLIF